MINFYVYERVREVVSKWVRDWNSVWVMSDWVHKRERERDLEVDWSIKRVGERVSASIECENESMIDWLNYWMSEGLSD